jgi:membrane dipeptidase
MESAGLILDLSHMAEASYFEALDLYHGPVIASHSNCRAYVPTDRQLSDEMIRALIKRDGVIGVVFFNQFLHPRWAESGKVKSQVTLVDVVKHIQHICEIAGDTLHAAIGSDFDGGFGAESIPAELDHVTDLHKLEKTLREAIFSENDVENIMSGNWLRTLKRFLPDK